MKTAYKIVLINVAFAIALTFLYIMIYSKQYSGGDTAFVFGLVCLAMGLLNLFLGCVLALTGKKQLRNGAFLSSAALLLLSGISCGGGAMF